MRDAFERGMSKGYVEVDIERTELFRSGEKLTYYGFERLAHTPVAVETRHAGHL